MTKRQVRIVASVLILAALLLIVIGLAMEVDLVWGAGLVAVVVAMAMSVATRWIGEGND